MLSMLKGVVGVLTLIQHRKELRTKENILTMILVSVIQKDIDTQKGLFLYVRHKAIEWSSGG